MKTTSVTIAVIVLFTGCEREKSLSESQLEVFFRNRQVSGKHVVALKKRSAAGISYLATIHGYPDNVSVCEELIKPYNKRPSMSVLAGDYYCEELR